MLDLILPSAEESELLRACLCGQDGVQAWTAWRARSGTLEESLKSDTAARRLLPLLSSALRRNGVRVESQDAPYLHTAALREQLRVQRYESVLGDALSILSPADLPIIVLKGAALAQLVYDDHAARHCHDVDLLVREGDLERAADRLAGRGFQRSEHVARPGRYDVRLVHSSGLPIELHSRLFQLSYYNLSSDAWSRSQTAIISGVNTRVLSPADQLLHVCGHASYSTSRSSLLWVCDAWHLIRTCPALDWQSLLDGASSSHLVLPLSIMLSYLAEELGAPIEAGILEQLRAAARHTTRLEQDVAVYGARAGTRATPEDLFRRSSGWTERVVLAQSILFPSPQFVRTIVEPRHRWPLLSYYLFRPLRFVMRRAYRKCATIFRRASVEC